MEETKKAITLPIIGMTCANCVAAVERNLNKLDGVQSANVNLASERASVEFDPTKVDQNEIIFVSAPYHLLEEEALQLFPFAKLPGDLSWYHVN